MKSSDEHATPSLVERLLMRHATRFSFEVKSANSLTEWIEADFRPLIYHGGGWRVRRDGWALCREKADARVLSWGRTPYYTIEEVEFAGRDQAVAMALDIAEGRVVVAAS